MDQARVDVLDGITWILASTPEVVELDTSEREVEFDLRNAVNTNAKLYSKLTIPYLKELFSKLKAKDRPKIVTSQEIRFLQSVYDNARRAYIDNSEDPSKKVSCNIVDDCIGMAEALSTRMSAKFTKPFFILLIETAIDDEFRFRQQQVEG